MANFETVSNADTVNSINRGSFWSDEEVHLLVSIWADEKIQQQLDSCVCKRPICEKMAMCLKEESNFDRTYLQIKEKIKQLKKTYRGIKDNNGASGRRRRTFNLFQHIDECMGDRPLTQPVSILESSDVMPCEAAELQTVESKNEIFADEDTRTDDLRDLDSELQISDRSIGKLTYLQS